MDNGPRRYPAGELPHSPYDSPHRNPLGSRGGRVVHDTGRCHLPDNRYRCDGDRVGRTRRRARLDRDDDRYRRCGGRPGGVYPGQPTILARGNVGGAFALSCPLNGSVPGFGRCQPAPPNPSRADQSRGLARHPGATRRSLVGSLTDRRQRRPFSSPPLSGTPTTKRATPRSPRIVGNDRRRPTHRGARSGFARRVASTVPQTRRRVRRP